MGKTKRYNFWDNIYGNEEGKVSNDLSMHRWWIERKNRAYLRDNRELIEFRFKKIEEISRNEYRKGATDARPDEGQARKLYKNRCKRHLRQNNKLFCRKVLKGEDYEDIPYPKIQDGKKFIWDFW